MKDLRRFLLALLGIAFVCAVLIAAVYAIEDWRGARAWDAAQNEVRLRGGTTDYAAIIPPPIPDDQNFAMAPIFAKALDYNVDPAESHPRSDDGWQRGHRLDLAAWQKYFLTDPSFPRASESRSPAAAVLLALSRYNTPLAELAHAAATRPKSRFPIDWNKPNPHSISVRQAYVLQQSASLLRLRAGAELAVGDSGTAAADIALIFRLSEALQSNPLFINHRVNVTILGLLAQPIWEGLDARRWSAGELARLQTLLLHENVLADYTHAVRAEQASAERGVDYLQQHADVFGALRKADRDASISSRLLWKFVSEAPRGWYDQNKARLVLYEQEYALEAADPRAHRVYPAKLAAGEPRIVSGAGPYTYFFQSQVENFDDLLPKSARIQTVCDQAAIACALERYFIDHQTYPDDLIALVPTYLALVPNDVIDGAPMRYRRTADGRYLLFGIGWNSRDDGGTLAWKESKPDYRAGDWVWQYQTIEPPSKSE